MRTFFRSLWRELWWPGRFAIMEFDTKRPPSPGDTITVGNLVAEFKIKQTKTMEEKDMLRKGPACDVRSTRPSRDTRALTYGERMIGMARTEDWREVEVRRLFARIVDICHDSRATYEENGPRTIEDKEHRGDKIRFYNIAIVEAEGAAMRVVKAITR